MIFGPVILVILSIKALKANIYIYNRILYLSLNFLTPFKKRFNEKPVLKGVKIQGLVIYSKIKGAKKLSPKTKPDLLIAYSNNNQYKLFNIKILNTF